VMTALTTAAGMIVVMKIVPVNVVGTMMTMTVAKNVVTVAATTKRMTMTLRVIDVATGIGTGIAAAAMTTTRTSVALIQVHSFRLVPV